jgi:hypothetical protein
MHCLVQSVSHLRLRGRIVGVILGQGFQKVLLELVISFLQRAGKGFQSTFVVIVEAAEVLDKVQPKPGVIIQ